MPEPTHFIGAPPRRPAAGAPSLAAGGPASILRPGGKAPRAWRHILHGKIDAARRALREEELDRAIRLLRDRTRAIPGRMSPSPPAPDPPTD